MTGGKGPPGFGCGVLGVIKPPGMTSHDLVRVLRSVTGERKVGHLGTLDPPAAGVLPLALGRATRLSALLLGLPKSYRAEVLFGLDSDTGDLAGRAVADAALPTLDAEGVRRAIESLAGRHRQAPPAYSARKVRGRRLYDLARRGRAVSADLASRARDIEVYRSEMVSFGVRRVEPHAGHPSALIDVCCSSGTYVRRLAAAAAEMLGTSGCLSFLLRTRSCGFELRDCLTVEQLLVAPLPVAAGPGPGTGLRAWRPAAEAVSFVDGVVVTPEAVRRASCGAPVPESEALATIPAVACGDRAPAASGVVRLLDGSGTLVALARREEAGYKPYAVLAEGVPR